MNDSLIYMEDALKKDVAGVYLDQVRTRFADSSAELQSQMNAGLPRNEFDRVFQLKTAVDTASTVTEKVWRQIHA